MAIIKGQLQQAQLENLVADPANLPEGRTWVDTVTQKPKVVIGGVSAAIATEPLVLGTKASPIVISTQITITGRPFTTVFIKSNGGNVDLTLAAIVGAVTNSQRVLIIGTSDTDTITLLDGENGPITFNNKTMAEYIFAENAMQEMWRNR